MRVRVRVLGDVLIKDRIGKNSIDIELKENSTVKDVIESFIEMYPEIKNELQGDLDRYFYQFSINGELVHPEEIGRKKVRHGDEVVIFPAIGGGGNFPSFL